MIAAPRTPAGLRWSCHGCGNCCTGHELGPVEPAIVAGLAAADIGSRWAPAASGWNTTRPGPDGPAVYLRQVGGACVFLQADRRCAVHALLGRAAKPGFCREFPYNLVEDPDGLVAVIRPMCAGFWRSFRDGDPVTSADVAEIAGLARVVPRARFAPPHVEIRPGQAIATAEWMAREFALLAALGDLDLDPAELVGQTRAHLGVGSAPRAAQYEAALQALCQALAHVLRGVLASEAGAPHQVMFARDALAMIDAARAGAPAALVPEARAWLNLLLRSAILSKSWAAWGSVAAGLGVWLTGVEIARRSGPGTPEGLAPALERWERFSAIPLVQLWLNKARPATVDLFLHAPAGSASPAAAE